MNLSISFMFKYFLQFLKDWNSSKLVHRKFTTFDIDLSEFLNSKDLTDVFKTDFNEVYHSNSVNLIQQ